MGHHHAHPHSHPPPPHHQLDQYQMHSQMGLMSEQQAYSQHQWHPQSTPESHTGHLMTNQTYHNLHSPTNHSTYHHLSSPNQQMLMMQPPTHPQQGPPPPSSGNQHQPQMSPQMSGNNYIGQSPPQTAPISNENGSTSDDSDDNAVNDPNVSYQNFSRLVP